MSIESSRSRRACRTRDEVLQRVVRLVAEQAGVAAETIRETDDLFNDLAFDSLDVIETAMEVEEEFDVTLPDETSQESRTVGQIADGVLRLLGQPAAD